MVLQIVMEGQVVCGVCGVAADLADLPSACSVWVIA